MANTPNVPPKPAVVPPLNPAVTEQPKPTAVPVKEPATKELPEREQLQKQIGEALAQYSGHESDIPTNHPYWQWVNRFRSLGK